MYHEEILTISYKHRYQIREAFRDILACEGINHFSLDLVRPDGGIIFFSITPSYGYEMFKRGYVEYEGILSAEYYSRFEFFWWDEANHGPHAEEIRAIREGTLGLKNSFVLVRHWDDYYIIYSFATKSDDPQFRSKVVNHLNRYLQLGDQAYARMRDVYSDYCAGYNPPYIEQFYSFEGGEPPARYSRHYNHRHSARTAHVPSNKIVRIDFGKAQ